MVLQRSACAWDISMSAQIHASPQWYSLLDLLFVIRSIPHQFIRANDCSHLLLVPFVQICDLKNQKQQELEWILYHFLIVEFPMASFHNGCGRPSSLPDDLPSRGHSPVSQYLPNSWKLASPHMTLTYTLKEPTSNAPSPTIIPQPPIELNEIWTAMIISNSAMMNIQWWEVRLSRSYEPMLITIASYLDQGGSRSMRNH